MREFLPLIIVGAVLGVFSIILIMAFMKIKNQKEAIGFDRFMDDGEITRRLLRYAKPYWKSFLLVLFVMLFSISYDIIAPILMGEIVNIIKADFELTELYKLVGIYASILIVSLVCSYVQAITLQKTGQKIISQIREDLFTHIQSLSHNQLNGIPVGKLVTRVTNDTGAISMMFTNLIVNLVKNCFIIVGVLVAMLCLNYMLTLMVLCFVPFIVLFTIIFRKFSRKAYRKVKDGTTYINTFLSENLSGMKIIQSFNREEQKKYEFDKKNEALGKSKQGEMLVFSIFRPLVYMLYVSSVLCLLYLAARNYIKDFSFLGQVITSNLVVTFYSYINKFYNPIQNLAEQFNWLQSAFASAEKIFTIFDMVPEVADAEDAAELESVDGNIEFKDVWFAYKPDEWVLKGVSFTVKAGDTIAFVGSTGSGKTTILSLLCRNWDIQKGQILVDGHDIRTIKKSSLRRHFGQMLQDVFLFSGTIRSNILLGAEGISDDEVMEACRYVNADHFIDKLSLGLDEPVRDRGNNFSAGQRQLLSFARTIVHKPSVMILDEATANIDTETELLIQDSLEKMMNIGTMLMVAHRLSTIQHADKILVLSHGEIIEQGNHAELLEKKGHYYGLYRMQFEKEAKKKELKI
ncbi:MAG: ABC transporter ATP-binding protein [Clostridia bacterium]|nr:ABC transporter ATP-binding protein [Clostridia bacterium]MBQ6905600.1 ABC transporter ATP-binding protein [Clostridia bacterium]